MIIDTDQISLAQTEINAEVEEISNRISQLQQKASTMPRSGGIYMGKLIESVQNSVYELKNRIDTGDAFKEIEMNGSLPNNLREVWKAAEVDRPLVILLDQAEEIFTQPNPAFPNELEEFMQAVKQIFGNGQDAPQGRLILSYRKEYFPEFEESLKVNYFPRETIFLKHLDREGIIEVVRGLTLNDRLKRKYKLTVEESLPEIIADDLLEDKDSPIAPVLQILLTKMWNLTEGEEERKFTVDRYQELRKQGLLMEDFFHQQMDALAALDPEAVASGLALDILHAHTTRLNTAAKRTSEELSKRYAHRADILPGLLIKFKQLYLLTDANDGTHLAHDTLAPIVKNEFRDTDYPGQRASRILENKVKEFTADTENVLDEADLKIVEEGKAGMHIWNDRENELVAASQERVHKILRDRKRVAVFRRTMIRLGVVALFVLLGLSAFAFWQMNQSKKHQGIAEQRAIQIQKEKDLLDKKNREAQENLDRAIAGETLAEKEKRLAEMNEEKALRQEQIAKANAMLANKNATKADIAAANALIEKARAEDEQHKADSTKLVAEFERDQAEKLRRLSAAQSMAAKSEVMSSEENPNLKCQLARLAYEFNLNEAGNFYDPTIYSALYKAVEELHPFHFQPIPVKTGQIWNVRFNTSGERFAATGDNGLLSFGEFTSEGPRITSELKTKGFSRALEFSPDGTWIAVGLSTGEILLLLADQPAMQPMRIDAHDGEVWALEFTANGKYLASSGEEGKVKAWQLSTLQIEAEYSFGARVNDLSLIEGDSTIVACLDQGQILTWDWFSGNAIDTLYDQVNDPPTTVAAMQNKHLLAWGTQSGKIFLHNSSTNSRLFTAKEHSTKVTALSFSSGEKLLASAGLDRAIKVRDLNHIAEFPIVIRDQTDVIWSLDFSPDDKYLIWSGNGVIKPRPFAPNFLASELCPLISTPLTTEEWDFYAGKDILYQKTCIAP